MLHNINCANFFKRQFSFSRAESLWSLLYFFWIYSITQSKHIVGGDVNSDWVPIIHVCGRGSIRGVLKAHTEHTEYRWHCRLFVRLRENITAREGESVSCIYCKCFSLSHTLPLPQHNTPWHSLQFKIINLTFKNPLTSVLFTTIEVSSCSKKKRTDTVLQKQTAHTLLK